MVSPISSTSSSASSSESPRRALAQEQAIPADLGVRTARGFVWMVGQTVGIKIISLLALIVLGRLLSDEQFGLVGLSYTVMSIVGVVQFIGINDVLVHRHAHLKRWINPAFWLSLTVGIIGGGMIALSAPLAAAWFEAPALINLLLLMALNSPLQTVMLIPQASLAASLRFRTSVIIASLGAAGISMLSMLLAWRGFGAASMILPIPLMNAAQLIALWIAARPAVRFSPQLRRWRFLLADTGLNWGVTVCNIIITTADHVILGRMFSVSAVGAYFYAVNLSTQILRLLNTNLMNVLLPSLSRLQEDPQRQINAFLQAVRLLTALMMPACLLQAALAWPLVRLLAESPLHGAAAPLAILSVGLAFTFITGPASSMMKATGRFRRVFLLSLAQAMCTVMAVVIAALMSERETAAWRVAIGYAACLTVFGPLFLLAAIRPAGLRWRSVGRVFAVPTISAVAAVLPAWWIARQLASTLTTTQRDQDVLMIIATAVITAILYPALVWLLDRRLLAMAWDRLRSLHRARGA